MEETRYIIDRFEGKYAVCETEDLKFENILRSEIPKEAKERDVLIKKDGKFLIDVDRTQKLKIDIEELTKDLWL